MKPKNPPVPGELVVLNRPLYFIDEVSYDQNSMGKIYLLLELRKGCDWEVEASTDTNLESGNAVATLMSHNKIVKVWLDSGTDLKHAQRNQEN